MNKKERLEIKRFATEIRLETLREVATRGFGHLAGSLSVVDVLAILYKHYMRIKPEDPQWVDRDLLVMSKGHAGPAVYATLALKGYFPKEWLKTLNQPGTHLPSHCDRKQTPGVDMTTGSLGQGVSTALGMTLANKLRDSDARTYLFVGDGEINEGQVWEGALFAAQQKLDHLVWFVDDNGKQLDGRTDDILALGDIGKKFEEFGFFSQTVNGHCMRELSNAIDQALQNTGKPSCIVLKTTKGKGIKALEEMELNHHIVVGEDFAKEGEKELLQLMEELDKELSECQ